MFGKAAQLRAILERGPKRELSAPVQAGMKEVDFAKPVAFVVDVTEAVNQIPDNPNDPLGMAKVGRKMKLVGGHMGIGGSLALHVFVSCEDAKGAEDVKALVDVLKLGMRMAKNTPKEAIDMMNQVKIVVKDKKLTADLTAKPSALKALAPLLGQKSEKTFQKVGQEVR
jgi:hypothetical protein